MGLIDDIKSNAIENGTKIQSSDAADKRLPIHDQQLRSEFCFEHNPKIQLDSV